MNFEIHTAAVVENGKCGIAIHLCCAHMDYASSRQMTFLYDNDDVLLGGLKAIEIAMSSIKNRCKQSPIVIYTSAEVLSLVSGDVGSQNHKSKAQFIRNVMSTFSKIDIMSPSDNVTKLDALECARSGKTKDTGTMVAE